MSNADEVRRMLEAPDERDYTRYPDKNIGCHICPASGHCYDAFMNHAVLCGNYATWDKTER